MNLAWDGIAWGVVLLLATAGWGEPVARGLLPGTRRSWPVCAMLGLVAVVAVGGIANLFAVLSAPAIIGAVGPGAAWWSWCLWRDRPAVRARLAGAGRAGRADLLLAALVAACVAVVAIRFAAAPVRSAFTTLPQFAGWSFNPHDDMYAYLVMPAKLLQTGHLAPDPFNARQLESSLGGTHLLNALGLAALPFAELHVVEEGTCLVIFLGMLATLLHAAGATPRVNALLLNVVVWSLSSNLNLSSYLSGAALLAGVLWLLVIAPTDRPPDRRWSVAMALLTAALVALKSTNIPLVGLLLATTFLARMIVRPNRRLAVTAITIAGVATVALAPWMIAMGRIYGTPLFPLLGRGMHWTAQAVPPGEPPAHAWAALLQNNSFEVRDIVGALALFAAVWAVPALRRRLQPGRSLLVVAVLVAWAVGTLSLSLSGEGIIVDRYLYPLMLVGVPLLLLALVPVASALPARRVAFGAWLSLVVLWIYSHHLVAWLEVRQAVTADLNPAAQRVPLDNERLRTQARRLQDAVPAGEKLLVRVTHPFLLDFSRNPVFVADWPGAVSPAPGMPLDRGAEALARYLVATGVRYLAYSYANEANYPARLHLGEARPDQPRWSREIARRSIVFQDLATELGITRRRMYDDGEIFVLDLAAYSGRIAPLRVN